MAADFQSLFGADTGDFSNLSGEASAEFDKFVNSIRNARSEFKDTADHLKVMTEAEKLRREGLAKGATGLKDFLALQEKFVKNLAFNGKSLKDLNGALRSVKAAVDAEALPKLKQLSEQQKQSSKQYMAAIASVGNGIVDTTNQMYTSAGNVVSFYRFWLSDMPKKFGGAFTKMGEVFKGWAEKSKAKREFKAAQADYNKFAQAVRKSGGGTFPAMRSAMEKFVKGFTAQVARFKTNSAVFERYMRRMNNANKAGIPGRGGGGSVREGLASKVGGVLGAVGSGLGMLGSVISAIGNIIANALDLAIQEATIRLESKFSAAEGFASQGVFTDDAFKMFGGDIATRRLGEFLKTGTSGLAQELEKNKAEFKNFFTKYGAKLTQSARLTFEGMQIGGRIDEIARRTIKSGESFTERFRVTYENLIRYNDVLTDQAKKNSINPKKVSSAMLDMTEALMGMNDTMGSASEVIYGFTSVGDDFKKVGVDMEKSLGSMTKSLVESVKKWDKGLKAFAGMKAFGGGSPFAGYYRASTGGDGALKAMLTPMLGYTEQIGKSLTGEGQKFMLAEQMLSQTLGFTDDNLVKVMSQTFERTGSFEDILNNPEYSQQIQKAMQIAGKSDSQILKLTYSQGERQLSIQLLQLEMQKAMLSLTTSALGVVTGMLIKISAILTNMYVEIGLGFARVVNFLGGSDEDYQAKVKEFGKTKYKTSLIEAFGDKLYTDSKTKFSGALKNLATLLDPNNPKSYLARVNKILDGGVKDNLDKSLSGIIDTAVKTSEIMGAKTEGEASKAAFSKNHFGGKFEKFHYGGIIKQGTEALLMSPNPTSVLSPNDTRQAVRGSKEKHVHVHFNAPVYGIPKFEEMVNRMVMKAATGVR